MTYVSHTCDDVEADTDCGALLPPDEDWSTTGSGCERYVNHQFSRVHETYAAATAGTCAEYEEYRAGVRDCFNDTTCPPNARCVGGTCRCGDVPLDHEPLLRRSCEGSVVRTEVQSCAPEGTLVWSFESSYDCADWGEVCQSRTDGAECMNCASHTDCGADFYCMDGWDGVNRACLRCDPHCDDSLDCTVDACGGDDGCRHLPDDSRCAGDAICDPERGCRSPEEA
ncbi:MAG: hypothetical protein H6721_31265 [Sandaracinus sp.]|nr:hypothetical protein [Sandaracinus sp.]